MKDKFIRSLDDIREEQDALLERQQDPDFALASDYAVGAKRSRSASARDAACRSRTTRRAAQTSSA